jgi:FkbM family methyltransferase
MATIDPAQVFYFSEGGEDFLLWSLFGYKSEGSYMDVGAFDGRYLSNSLSFARAGWRGVCVEPTAKYSDQCAVNQPDAVCVRAACVDDPKVMSVHFNAEPLGVYSRIELSENDEHRLNESYQRYSANLSGFEEVEVPATTVSQLIDKHLNGQAPDFLSIDVEGGEIRVLKGVDFERHRPRVIVAEANDDEHKEALVSWLSDQGYPLIRNVSNNYFFSCDPDIVEQGRRMHIQCVIERHLHPMGLQYTFRGIALGKVIDEARQKELAVLRSKSREQDIIGRRADSLEKRNEVLAREIDRDRQKLLEASQQLIRATRRHSKLQERLADMDHSLRNRITELEMLLGTCKDRRDQLNRALEKDRADLQEISRKLDIADKTLSLYKTKIAEMDSFISGHILVPRLFKRSRKKG